ncbi:hypothetical protein Tco_1439458 [Tanacetum coccineum]
MMMKSCVAANSVMPALADGDRGVWCYNKTLHNVGMGFGLSKRQMIYVWSGGCVEGTLLSLKYLCIINARDRSSVVLWTHYHNCLIRRQGYGLAGFSSGSSLSSSGSVLAM